MPVDVKVPILTSPAKVALPSSSTTSLSEPPLSKVSKLPVPSPLTYKTSPVELALSDLTETTA